MHDQNLSFTSNACFLLGKTVCDFFPKAKLEKSHVWGPFFAIQFYLDQPVEESSLSFLQESFLQAPFLKKAPNLIEMMTQNAKELFRHHKQYYLEKKLKNILSPTIKLYHLEGYYNWAKTLNESPFEGKISLQKVINESVFESQVPTYQVTLIGVWAKDSQKLKEAQKNLKLYLKEVDLENTLSEERGVLTTPQLQEFKALKKSLTSVFEAYQFNPIAFNQPLESIAKDYFNQADSFSAYKATYFLIEKEENLINFFLNQGGFSKKNHYYYFRRGLLKNQLEVKSNYCLKFILEILKILGFSNRVVLSSRQKEPLWEKSLETLGLKYKKHCAPKSEERIDFYIEDPWNRELLGFSMTLQPLKDFYLMQGQMKVSLEELFFWLKQRRLINQKEKKSFVNEFIKILSVKGGLTFALEVAEALSDQGYHVELDFSEKPLKEKLHKAYKQKPFDVLIIGEQEQKERKVKRAKEELSLTLDAFIQSLKTKETES